MCNAWARLSSLAVRGLCGLARTMAMTDQQWKSARLSCACRSLARCNGDLRQATDMLRVLCSDANAEEAQDDYRAAAVRRSPAGAGTSPSRGLQLFTRLLTGY